MNEKDRQQLLREITVISDILGLNLSNYDTFEQFWDSAIEKLSFDSINDLSTRLAGYSDQDNFLGYMSRKVYQREKRG